MSLPLKRLMPLAGEKGCWSKYTFAISGLAGVRGAMVQM